MMSLQTKINPGQIVIANTLASAFTQAKPDEYQDLRSFYRKVAATEQEELVLTTVPAVPSATVEAAALAGKGN